ncbi:MAG: hypothetical protein V7K21_19885 [Nostoc sp.]
MRKNNLILRVTLKGLVLSIFDAIAAIFVLSLNLFTCHQQV